MNKTLLIFRQEFIKTLRRKGFIILTLSLPVLALLGIVIFNIVSGSAKPPPEATRIGYVDEAGYFERFNSQGKLTFVPFGTEQEANKAFIEKDINEYFVIPPDFISTGVVRVYLTQKELAPSDATMSSIKNFVAQNLLSGNVRDDIITRVLAPLYPVSITLTPTGEVAPNQSGYANLIVPGIFSLLLAISLVTSATYVLQSLGEEKENRLMEILMSSVSAKQLLTGKVLGLGAAGLLQVVFWVITSPLLLALASSSIGGFISTLRVPAGFWILGIVYFILGYLFVATVSASIAAVASTVQEAQGISGLYTMFNLAPFWLVSLLMLFPNNPAWVVLSIFPFTAPVMIMMRLGLLGVPAWQLAVSMIVLVLSILGGLMLASRLLRAYMLMYGKRPGLGEIIRSLKSA